MKNDYEIRGDVTAIIINSTKHGRQECLISTSKFNLVNELPIRWYVHKQRNTLYVKGNKPKSNGKRKDIFIHRIVSDAPSGMVVDHINHDTLNNTDDNLRVITNYDNGQNRKGAQSNSKSGVRGVSWHKAAKKWCVQISVNKEVKHIGSFDDIHDAEHAAIQARAHHMPFSNEMIE